MNTMTMMHDLKMLPDVSTDQIPENPTTLNWVGMNHIEVPVILEDTSWGRQVASGKATALVDINQPLKKGIHMSRLYLDLIDELEKTPLSATAIARILAKFQHSQKATSANALVEVRFRYLTKRNALVTDNTGFRSYPVKVKGTLIDGDIDVVTSVQIAYSSTCPCSTALARQLVRERFEEKYAEASLVDPAAIAEWLEFEPGIYATPHSQRSLGDISIRTRDFGSVGFRRLIDIAENALHTPVQTAVKRLDEQEFTRINGENLMFCEDAARALAAALENVHAVTDYKVYVQHLESLHAHDAVACKVKGQPGGFTAAGE
ncbi:MAG: GTP cyclohydrolase I FolE2 [Chitinivibrionales bacterium]|nr:GTP cyclohydrolase I FolE2 [Chitinivibrionales bacterium]